MQVSFASWTTFLGWLIGLMISAAIIIAVGMGAVWAVKRVIGEHNYPALTMLLAVMGGMAALYSTLSGPRERGDDRARLLVYATDIATQNLFLVATGDKLTGEIGDPSNIDPSALVWKLFRLESISKALGDIPVTDFPSAASMSALVRARAASSAIYNHAREAVVSKTHVNLELDMVELSSSLEVMRTERDRLYPMYQVGPVVVGKMPQQR